MSYAIISLGGKQYRVQEGERLVVDRVPEAEGKTFTPRVLFVGGDGNADFAPSEITVTARVVGHVLGRKIRIGKYKPKSGYRRHTGYRSRLSQIAIESIGARKARPTEPAQDDAGRAPRKAEVAPPDYEGLKVTEVSDWAKGRHLPTLEAALAYEQEHAARKGAINALESAIARRKEGS